MIGLFDFIEAKYVPFDDKSIGLWVMYEAVDQTAYTQTPLNHITIPCPDEKYKHFTCLDPNAKELQFKGEFAAKGFY